MTKAPGADHGGRQRWWRRAAGGLALLAAAGATPASAAPTIGQPAPAFTATDTNGQPRGLGEFTGRVVVLEWTNHECPFVQRHYRSGNMQSLQKDAAADNAVWLTIISSAPGQQGHVSAAEANALTRERNAAPTAVLLDPSGAIGRAYGAVTTPHMFVIDREGTLVYMGAIDDQPSNFSADPARATNYVRQALAEVAAGKPVATASTRPYGCSVKYAN